MSTETPIQPPTSEVPLRRGVIDHARSRFLINRNFALLAVGQVISNVGDNVYSITLLIWVYSLTHSAAALSGVLVAQYVPIFLLGPVAGVFVDRWNRRTTMIVSDVTRASLAMLPFFVPESLRLPAIYASIFMLSTFGRFFMPARSGLMQVIVSPARQTQAAAISQTTFALSFIIGPAIASPLYFIVGPFFACLINTISYLVSAFSIRLIRAPKELLHPYSVANGKQASGGIGRVMRELLAGFRFVATSRTLLVVTILALIAMLGAGSINALDLIFVNQNLHTSSSVYGLIVSAGGVGVLVGAVCIGFVANKIGPKYLLVGGVILVGAGIIVYAFQTWFVMAIIINFFLAIPQAGIEIGFGPLLLNSTPESMMGRVQSVVETAMFGTSLISAALAGYFGQFIPVYIIFIVGGVIIVLSGVFGWFGIPTPDKEISVQSSQLSTSQGNS